MEYCTDRKFNKKEYCIILLAGLQMGNNCRSIRGPHSRIKVPAGIGNKYLDINVFLPIRRIVLACCWINLRESSMQVYFAVLINPTAV
jgi:hypothetical protein